MSVDSEDERQEQRREEQPEAEPEQRQKGINLSDLERMPSVELSQAAAKAREKYTASFELTERIRRLTELGNFSPINKIARQLSEQHKLIDSISRPNYVDKIEAMTRPRHKLSDYLTQEPPSLPTIHIPPNPLHETNRRLATIEDRFDKMQEIAARGAEIATNLQVSAAEFLTKFDDVASKSDRTAGRAVVIAIIAAVMAAAVPIGQTVYTEIWKTRNDAAEMQKVILELKAELGTLRDTQRQAADRVGEAITASNAELANAILLVRDNLGRGRTSTDDATGASPVGP